MTSPATSVPRTSIAVTARPGDRNILKPDLCQQFPDKFLERNGIHRPDPLHEVLPHLPVVYLDLVGESLLVPPGQPDVAFAELLEPREFPPPDLPLDLGEDAGIHGCFRIGTAHV